MHYDPRTEDQPQAHRLLQHCTGPRPVAWISSSNSAGDVELSVLPHWQWLSPQSPILLLSALPNADGSRAKTVENAEQTGWFVWNLASSDLREAVQKSRTKPAPRQSAFEHAAVCAAPSVNAPCPRIAQSAVHFECRYLSTQRIPSHRPGELIDLVLAEVVRVHLKDEILSKQPRLQPLAVAEDGSLVCLPQNGSAVTVASEFA